MVNTGKNFNFRKVHSGSDHLGSHFLGYVEQHIYERIGKVHVGL